jgi:outer membrane protein TolC
VAFLPSFPRGLVIVKHPLHFATCAIAGFLIPCATWAQSGSLAAAVDAAWARSVQATSAEGHLSLAAVQETASNALWAAPPSVEVSYRSDRLQGNLGRSESEAGVAWPLLMPGQRDARQATAQAERHAAEATRAAARLRIAGEVREAAWTFTAREAESSVAERHERSLRDLSDDVERRVRAGDLARADALAARAEFLAASAALAEAQHRLEAARAQWKSLTGLEQVPDPTEAPVRPTDAPHPEIVLAAVSVQGARSRLEVVRASRSEPPELLFRYRRETAASGLPAENTLGIGVRIPLGTDDRNLPRERAALVEVDVASAEELRQRRRLESEAQAASFGLRSAERQVEAEAARAELLRERAALIDKSFRAGESALPELLRAAAAAAQAEAALASQRAALGLARARLNQINGKLP